MRTAELTTPALLVEARLLEDNIRTMADALPGPSVASAREGAQVHGAGAAPGRGGPLGIHLRHRARRWRGWCERGWARTFCWPTRSPTRPASACSPEAGARITVAVDSDATIDAAARAGVPEVLIDVNVGLPRCGCPPEEAGRLADRARAAGSRGPRRHGLRGPHRRAGGPGGAHRHARGLHGPADAGRRRGGRRASSRPAAPGPTTSTPGPPRFRPAPTRSMDTAYGKLGLPFTQALSVLSTVISVSDGWAVADCGLKALGMDHGDPSVEGAEVWFCSDEHLTFAPAVPLRVGDRVRVLPAHVDPTVAYHELLYVVDGDEVVDRWDVDLRGW